VAANDGEHPVTSLFGSDLPAGTGAEGTPGVTAAQSSGPVLGSPVVSNPFGSSQVAANLPTAQVVSGDTCSSSADGPVPPAGDPLTGISLDAICSTGAGRGSLRDSHPNAGYGLIGGAA
jgi:hypothetical protein